MNAKKSSLILGLSLALAIGCARAGDVNGDGGVSDFYRWHHAMPARPGVMLRTEKLGPDLSLAQAAINLRILYSSTEGVSNHGIVIVSGALFLPKGRMPTGGWPIVAWAHGTTGIADVCAPSWHGRTGRDQAYLNAWLQQGYAVVATDYQGLGTPGMHPYLLWRPEGYSVLDSVRAVLARFPRQLQNKLVIIGQSQGSGAALGASYLVPLYAPELNLRGTVATGLVLTFKSFPGFTPPSTKTASLTDPTAMNPGFAMLRVAGTDRAIHPDLLPDDFVTARAKPLLAAARGECLRDLFKLSARMNLKPSEVFSKNLNPIDGAMEANFELPSAKMPAPVFVGTGLADSEAGTAGQYNGVAALCKAGSVVQWHKYPGLTHGGAVNGSLPDSEPFVRAVMNGRKINSNCADISDPGPIQTPKAGVKFND